MSISELGKLIAEETGNQTCPICGTPFKPMNGYQKTCGHYECQRQWRKIYKKEYGERMKDDEEYKKRRAEQQRKYRSKKKAVKERDKQLEKIAERWERQKDFEDGIHYGKRQMEKTLAMVPKIDVSLGGNDDGKSVQK